jgi:glycosyltransferase involved in cell wall biosynthesis
MSMKTKNILVYTQWPFFDGLTLSYVLPYLLMIKKHINRDSIIYLVTQEKNTENLKRPEVLSVLKDLSQKNIIVLSEKYYPLGLKKIILQPINLVKLFLLLFTKKIDVIHTQGMSAGMIGCILSWFSGKKLIVDSYEPLADSMVEGDIWSKAGLTYKIVKFFEKKQAQRAKYVIADTESMQQYALKTYGIVIKNFFWKPACVDVNIFKYNKIDDKEIRAKYNLQDKVVAIYVGKFGSQYLEHEIFDFFVCCKHYWGEKFRVLILTSHSDEELISYCNKSAFPFELITKAFVPHADVKKYLSVGNFAITPVKPLPSKRYCTPIKDGEYWSIGLPVVITPNISDDSDIIEQENIGAIIIPNIISTYELAIKKIDLLMLEDKNQLQKRIRNVAIKYRGYENAELIYESIYTKIFAS